MTEETRSLILSVAWSFTDISGQSNPFTLFHFSDILTLGPGRPGGPCEPVLPSSPYMKWGKLEIKLTIERLSLECRK